MLVWVASFPRSGNTFLRIVLHRLYGVRTSVVYDIDGVAARLGADAVGFEERPASLEAMRAAGQPYFIKTHRRRDEDVHGDDRVLALVRDGRDALVSWARQRCEQPGRDFHAELERMVTTSEPRRAGSWGSMVLSWLPPTTLLRYEDLIRDPPAEVGRILAELDLPSPPGSISGAAVPTFAELHGSDPAFFRRGHAGTHRDELPPDLHDLFWSRPDNAEAMTRLRYLRC